MRRAVILLAASALLAGCGNERTDPPDLGRIAAPTGFKQASLTKSGISLKVPVNWRGESAEAPQVATLSSGDAQVAIWRYERVEPLPESRPQLSSARDELLKATRERDATFEVSETRVVIKPGVRAVEIVGVGSDQGARRKVRSLHIYGRRTEVVIDAFAPESAFAKVDKQTFGPLTRSAKLTRPKS